MKITPREFGQSPALELRRILEQRRQRRRTIAGFAIAALLLAIAGLAGALVGFPNLGLGLGTASYSSGVIAAAITLDRKDAR
jgi:ferric-dicitrate binding protein FerR (iron transport regulator)